MTTMIKSTATKTVRAWMAEFAMIANLDFARGRVIDPAFVDSHDLLNIVSYTANDLRARIETAETTLKFLGEATARLSAELEGR